VLGEGAQAEAVHREVFERRRRFRLPFKVPRVAFHAGPPVVLLLLALVVLLSATDESPPAASEPSRRDRAERVYDDAPKVDEASKPPGPGAVEARRELLAARNIKSWVKGAEALTTLTEQEPHPRGRRDPRRGRSGRGRHGDGRRRAPRSGLRCAGRGRGARSRRNDATLTQ
jgi:hypothetical protein